MEPIWNILQPLLSRTFVQATHFQAVGCSWRCQRAKVLEGDTENLQHCATLRHTAPHCATLRPKTHQEKSSNWLNPGNMIGEAICTLKCPAILPVIGEISTHFQCLYMSSHCHPTEFEDLWSASDRGCSVENVNLAVSNPNALVLALCSHYGV